MWRFLYPFGSFIAGFTLMGFEIIASRVIAPLVGNSLYSWASVISVILFGLSFGAWLGGKLADKEKHTESLVYIFLVSSFFIALVPIISLVLEILPPFSGIIVSSLVYAVVLFLPASFTLGMIQPLLLKEYVSSFHTIGQRYGMLSMLWSLGSILGVLLMGFVFISFFGTTVILFGLSVLCLLYSSCIIIHKKELLTKKYFVYCILSLLLVTILYFVFIYLHTTNTLSATIFEKDTGYYHLKIVDSNLPEFGFSRSLFLDYDIHSIEQQNFVPFLYTNVFPVFGILSPNPKNILVIGAGAYTVPKNISSYYKTSVDVLEIDNELPAIAKKYFGYDENTIHTTTSEARLFLRTDKKIYDIIYGDAYNSFISIPWYLTTQEYYKLTKSKLSKNGICVMSFVASKNPTDVQFLQSMFTTFTSVYPTTYVFSFIKPSERVGNFFFIGMKTDEEKMSEEELKSQLRKLGKYSFLREMVLTSPEIHALFASSTFPQNNTVLHDDYAPVESLMKPIVISYFKEYSLFVSYIKKQIPDFKGEVLGNTLFFKAF